MPDTASPDIASIDRGSCWQMRVVIVGAVLVAFGISIRFGFVGWGDAEEIAGNRSLNPPTLAGLSHLWRHADHQMYTPVAATFWWLLAHLRGASGQAPLPIVFHIANVIVHIAASLIVF